MPGRTRTPDFDVRTIRAHGTSPRRAVRFRVINQYWHQPETKLGSMGNDPVIEENSFVSVGAERLMMEANPDFLPSPCTWTPCRHTMPPHRLTDADFVTPERSTNAYRVKFSALASALNPSATSSES